MGTGGVPAAAVTVVSPSGGSGIHGPSRKPARRAVSLPIISVSWRRESESFTACHANAAGTQRLGPCEGIWMARTFRAVAASITFGKDAGFRRKTGVASLDAAPKPSIRTGAARAAIGRRATRAQPAPTKQTCGKRTRGGVGVVGVGEVVGVGPRHKKRWLRHARRAAAREHPQSMQRVALGRTGAATKAGKGDTVSGRLSGLSRRFRDRDQTDGGGTIITTGCKIRSLFIGETNTINENHLRPSHARAVGRGILRLARRGALQPRHRLGDMGLIGGGVGGEQLDDGGVALLCRHVDGRLARR